ncbi:MAG TPA: hypothetical protein VI583_13115 [Cyclobacteriaceae bacterium]|nr:hypothetical protein [Cyclobacteriaceae bacterium]
MKVKLDKSSLIEQFKDNLRKIKFFCDTYDQGNESIALEIAVKLRILFHNSNNSKSLLRQLKLEDIPFISTSHKYNSKNLINHHGLLSIKTSIVNNILEKAILVPRLNDEVKKVVTFKNWWSSEKVIAIKHKIFFTRKDIILELADTDGGAHVDDSLKEEYFNLSRMNSLGWRYHDSKTNKDLPFNNPVQPCIRQIGYEVLLIFKNFNFENKGKLH